MDRNNDNTDQQELSRNNLSRDRYTHAQKQCEKCLLTAAEAMIMREAEKQQEVSLENNC